MHQGHQHSCRLLATTDAMAALAGIVEQLSERIGDKHGTSNIYFLQTKPNSDAPPVASLWQHAKALVTRCCSYGQIAEMVAISD
jgi:hypothetical protein